ncbi:hypothetical protein SKAU_G00006160 [Synaphobranchus kaupii]|uniref:Uncharacterized protein n=1 Tax=Synaphobranchus kaupii TaxID=118154 RepID=A0A9Q1GA07_SYNKA|nr:hypothetical protein SKAU_G00006160 [Synaphobranchus kaupii]
MEEDPGCVADPGQLKTNAQALHGPRAPPECRLSDGKPEEGEEEDVEEPNVLNEARGVTGNGASVDIGLLTRPSMPLSPCPTLAVHVAVSGTASCDGLDSREGASLDMNGTDLALSPSHLHPPCPMKGSDEAAMTEKDLPEENYVPGSPPPSSNSTDGPQQECREEEPLINAQEEDGLARGELKDVKALPKELLTGESHEATEGTRQEAPAHSGLNAMAAESQAITESMETASPPVDGRSGQRPLDCYAEWIESVGGTEQAGGSTAELTPVWSAATDPEAGGNIDQPNSKDINEDCSLPIRSAVTLTREAGSSQMEGMEGKETASSLAGHEEEEEKEEEDEEDQNNLLQKSVESQCAR